MDRLEQIVKELTATRVKLDMLCQKVDNLAAKIENDHNTILNHEGRISHLENWVEKHEKQHSFSLSWRLTVAITLLASATAALFSWLFNLIR